MEYVKVKKSEDTLIISFQDSLTVRNVREIKSILDESITHDGNFRINFSSVNEADSAGFQLVAIFLRELKNSGKNYTVEELCESLLGISNAYNMEL